MRNRNMGGLMMDMEKEARDTRISRTCCTVMPTVLFTPTVLFLCLRWRSSC